jgi:long-chain acyl-CoA synthetase
MAVNVGWKNFNYKYKQSRFNPVILLNPVFHKIIGQKVHHLLGGNLQLAASGGAALPEQVAKTFIGLGVNIFQGYGMTESSPAVTMNNFSLNIPRSVGEKIPGIELRIGKNDELQVKGPVVMLGYWNNHQATSKVMTEDGWLRTGDKAEIIGRSVFITGRIKDILIMSNGEKIPPVDMEQAICLNPNIEQALIVGEGKAYLSALIVLNGEHWPALAQQHGLDPLDETSLHNKKLHSTVIKQVCHSLHDFPGYAKVRKVMLTLEPWTSENDLLTPTMKIKRAKVVDKFQDEIEQMYEN